ncbi:unnamed protein product [Pseudo-nitzschia multistriata]|uniref:Sugar phosphate transporter domain-containing protein n=1 Tax=Pseudo-nitzschia multistriata TaxID=183589 RepID=A0A448YUS1_9STRA|nr:unnamed protein product [Pseudo-nitzschia multistriata]
MTWKEWASVSVPCGIVTALDIGFSNLALVTITLTFYTMVKASTPIFVLSWAYIFKIERITWPLIGVVIVIAMGEFLTVFGEVDFVFHGFALCLLASVLSGARWTLVQLKLQNLDPPLKSTLVTMKLLTPSMVWSMVFLSIVIEKPWVKLVEAQDNDSNELLKVFLLGMIGGTFAIVMILCELYLILKASAIILMIGGVIKELTTIFVGVSFFGDRLNLMNTAGVCVVFSGVMLYKVVFHLQKKENERSGMEPIQSEDVFDEDEQDFANESDEEFLDEDQETFVDEVPGVSNLNCESELLDEEVKLEMATRYS